MALQAEGMLHREAECDAAGKRDSRRDNAARGQYQAHKKDRFAVRWLHLRDLISTFGGLEAAVQTEIVMRN
jgi:hypothetical protein